MRRAGWNCLDPWLVSTIFMWCIAPASATLFRNFYVVHNVDVCYLFHFFVYVMRLHGVGVCYLFPFLLRDAWRVPAPREAL